MRKFNTAGVEKEETVEYFVCALILSELHMLAIYLSLLLLFLDYFLLKLEFRSLSTDMNHLVHVGNLNWEGLRLLRDATRGVTSLAGKLLSIIGSFKHFIAARDIWWDLARIKLPLARDRNASSPEVACTITLSSGVKVDIISSRCCEIKIVVLEARARIFHTSSSH